MIIIGPAAVHFSATVASHTCTATIVCTMINVIELIKVISLFIIPFTVLPLSAMAHKCAMLKSRSGCHEAMRLNRAWQHKPHKDLKPAPKK